MSETTTENNAYDKLTPQRKALVDQVIKNLESGNGLWTPGWKMSGVPESGITGKQYHGVNNFYLTIISMMKGYHDNRWATFNQIEEKGWKFKTDEEGKSLGKGAGVTIEFFEFRDRETKKAFDRHVLDGMTADERQEAKIIYDGNQAFYRPITDEVHLPPRNAFVDMQEFYSTALHEVGHSTGHASRLNRDLSGGFGSEGYAQEELRAEIASMFMEQDLEIDVSEKHIENNSRYIKNWHEEIKANPNALFLAITDADKIARYVIEKERLAANKKNTEYYAIVPRENELGDMTYVVYMASEYGQTSPAIAYAFSSRDALMTEFDKFKQAPFWKDKIFEEVSFDELQVKSIERYEAKQKEEEKKEPTIGNEEYLPPSQVAARALSQDKKTDMTGRGAESLTRMSDREIVERAEKTKGGEKFKTLYNGGTLFGNEEKDARSLMVRIAMFCNGDQEQLMRIFKSSGQFKEEKSNELYEKMAKESMRYIDRIKQKEAAPIMNTGKQRAGINAKT